MSIAGSRPLTVKRALYGNSCPHCGHSAATITPRAGIPKMSIAGSRPMTAIRALYGNSCPHCGHSAATITPRAGISKMSIAGSRPMTAKRALHGNSCPYVGAPEAAAHHRARDHGQGWLQFGSPSQSPELRSLPTPPAPREDSSEWDCPTATATPLAVCLRSVPPCVTSTPESWKRNALWPTVVVVRRLSAVGCLIRLAAIWVESCVGHPDLAVATSGHRAKLRAAISACEYVWGYRYTDDPN